MRATDIATADARRNSYAAEACIGTIVGKTIEGYPIVNLERDDLRSKPARTTIRLDDLHEDLIGARVLLVFENQDPDLPIIVGCLAASQPDVPLSKRRLKSDPADNVGHFPQSLVLEAQHEIVLRCGHSSLTLKRDGKILLRGRDLVSRASRRNRIQGSSVDIN